MDLIRLIYSSRPFGFDQAILNGILLQARRRNASAEITGALICRADLYLQLLEGPPGAVDACYARILRDDRHLEVTLRHRARAPHRMFGQWAMRDDPAKSWMWDREAVANGALDRESAEGFQAVFARLRREVPET
jgi:hypothetical protein